MPEHLLRKLTTYVEIEQEHWPDGIPTDQPKCGFQNEYCQVDYARTWLIVGLTALFAVIAGGGLYCYVTHLKIQKLLYEDAWKIKSDDITNILDQKSVTTSSTSLSSGSKRHTAGPVKAAFEYKGQPVHVTSYKRKVTQVVTLRVAERRRLAQIRSLHHDNIATFHGMTLDAKPELVCVWQSCRRGRLVDLLMHDELDLDEAFVTSMLKDVARGLSYIHSSPVQYHGSINSNNIHVDKRWVLKFVGTGIDQALRRHVSEGNLELAHDEYELLHRPPEELRALESGNLAGSQAGDMYATAMVAYQIVWKDLIFCELGDSYEEIIFKILDARNWPTKPPPRPPLKPSLKVTGHDVAPRIKNLLTECWSENPMDRPFAKVFNTRILAICGKRTRDLMDHMMTLMEKYTNNLERIVRERTQKVEDEKRRADYLLYQLLPRSVADKLMAGIISEPHEYRSATVFFSDIVNFTEICSISTPMQVVATLNTVFTAMDTVLEKYDVYKVETVGDAYMVVSGVPKENGEKHCTEIADMALEIRQVVADEEFAKHTPQRKIKMRFGINSGPTAAGIIGHTMPRYCLFGGTINIASRLESTGLPMKIQISGSTKNLLDKVGGYSITLRGEVELKGKGKLKAYWLEGYVTPAEPHFSLE